MAIELNQIWDFPIKEFHPFPRALMGVGAHDILGVEAKNLGFKRALLMTTGLRGSGIIEELIGKIEYQASRSSSTTRSSPTPRTTTSWRPRALPEGEVRLDHLRRGRIEPRRREGARVVIAHDGRNINEFEGFAKSTNKENPPHIAVSTTAGTGSETSWAYVITDTSDMDHPHKWVGFDEATIVTLAIDDPLLYYSCPQHFTAYCGFDVLAHGSEPYVSRLDFARRSATPVLDRARREAPA